MLSCRRPCVGGTAQHKLRSLSEDSGRGGVRVCSVRVMAPLGSSMPFVSSQQVALVFVLICESDAMEKEKKLDSGRIFSPGCRPQAHGHLRVADHLSRSAASKQRRARRRSHAILTAFPAAGDSLRSLPIRTVLQPAAPPRKFLVQGRLALSETDYKLRVLDPPDSRDCNLVTMQRL